MRGKQTGKTVLRRLPGLNLLNRPFRTCALAALVALLVFVLFGGSVLDRQPAAGPDKRGVPLWRGSDRRPAGI